MALVASLTAPLPAHAGSAHWDEAQLDALVESYRQDNGIPGISVAVVQGGQDVYAKGFGWADTEESRVATAESVYNIASVSKVIGATLAAKLEADPDIDLNLADDTSDYLPTDAPGFDDAHLGSHSLEDLLTHRGCIGHYGELGNTTDHYGTALDAAAFVWAQGLIDGCTVGFHWNYSTHSFTLLGAALEEATGDTIHDLLEDELFAPHQLGSLRAQFAAEDLPDNAHRVTPYTDDGTPGNWQDNSWKVLGGGIEGNAVDLALFGWHVLNGDIVDPSVRDDRLWQRYIDWQALGWRVETDDHDRPIAHHGGSWSGARAHLQVYREDDLAISVLSNRRGTDEFDDDGDRISHNPRGLVQDIADVVLYAPPEVTVAHDPVIVDEGTVAANEVTISTAANAEIDELTASVGEVVGGPGDAWQWSWQTVDGPGDSQPVTITVKDDRGEEGTVTFDLVVNNVAPEVTIDPDQVVVFLEGDEVAVEAEFTDPGWEDTHTVDIDWGVPDDHPGEEVAAPDVEIVAEGGPGVPRRGVVTAAYRYGDTDMGHGFEVTVTVEDDDGGVGTDSVTLTVNNVAPTIDEVGHDHDTVELQDGSEAILASSGDLLEFDVEVSDPGSDDLRLEVDFGDGTQVWADTSLVNDPLPEPAHPTPEVDPREVLFQPTHTYADPCTYEATFTVTDDDGGERSEALAVIITGTADAPHSAGYWLSEYHQRGRTTYDPGTLECFLAIVGQLSGVFHDPVDASGLGAAGEVLHPRNAGGLMEVQFDRQLLTAWANLASGAIGYHASVDSTGDGEGDTPFHEVLAAAEDVRLDTDATRGDLEAHKDILERINTG